MFQNKKLWIILFFVIVIIGGGYYYYSNFYRSTNTEVETPTVQTAVARRGDLVIFASGAGSIVPATTIGLGFSSSGTLSELLVNVGDEVQAGQVIARLKTNNTEASIAASVTSAELSVLEARQALDNIHTNWALEAAQALIAVEDAGQNLELMQNPELRQAQALQAIAKAGESLYAAEIAYNRTQLTASQANIDAAYAELILAQQSLDRAQDNFARYANKAEDNLQRAQAQSQLSSLQQKYDNAAANYNAAIGTASESEIALAEAGLAVAQATLIEAQQAWERIQYGSTPGEIALVEAQLAAAHAEWARIKDGPDPDEIHQAEIKLANAEAKLTVAQEEQAFIDLVAPMDGSILSISASVGEFVSTNAIVTLADLSQPLLDVYLDETDLYKVAVGFEVEVIFDALPDDIFTGHVIEVDPSLATVSNIQAVRALVSLDADSYAKPQTLPVGLNASVDVIGGRAENAVLVPVEALRELGPDEYAVFVMEDGEPKLRVVTVGLVDFTFAEILSGLEAGEIVTTGIVETE